MWMCGQNDTDSSPLLEHADERRFLAPLPERGGSRPALVKWCVEKFAEVIVAESTQACPTADLAET